MKVCRSCNDNIEEQGGYYAISIIPPHIPSKDTFGVYCYFCNWTCLQEWVE